MKESALFVCGFPGTSPNDELRKIIDQGIGGVILFERNVSDSKAELEELIAWIREAYKKHGLATPVIAIDHEGGRVHRLKKHATRFPLPAENTAPLTPETCYRQGRIQGQELKQLGFNLVFAPVYDLGAQGEYATALGARTFSANPQTCAELADATRMGLESSGIIATAKHYPGYGSVIIDPHEDLPIVEKSLDRLMKEDLLPFHHAIEQGCRAIMSAHILNKTIDSHYPATLSSQWGKILRESFKYRGVLISDDLCMGAVCKHYPVSAFVPLAIDATVDIQLICHPLENDDWTSGIREGIKAIQENQDIGFRAKLDASLKRITDFRSLLA